MGPRPGHFTGNAVKMSEFADALSPFVDRPVLDRTNLDGRFDLQLDWSPDQTTSVLEGDLVSIFTAIQEQLGLKLEPARGGVDVMVIDVAHRPSPD